MDDLNVGTKEVLSVNVDDRLDTINDLTPYAVYYRVLNEDDSVKLAWTIATDVVVMRVDCLVDTTTGGGWAAGTYKLYIRPTIGAEQPILGPFEFNLI